MEKSYHIAHFGTFDIESMGDSMFPNGLAFGMNRMCPCTYELFSMSGCEKPYNNNNVVYSISQFAERHLHHNFDAVILGGGEFLNFHQIHFNNCIYPAGYLWKEPIRLAQERHIPIIINCVGVASDLTENEKEQLNSYLRNVAYISIRDNFSAKRLQTAKIHYATTVADNLWYMNQMYPQHEMCRLRQNLAERFGRDYTAPYIIVQYGTTKDTKSLAQALRLIKAETGYRILLMAVNYCHEDRVGMQMLYEEGNGEFELLDDYLQPPEMIAVISGAKTFMGTSLHGNLTAASYGVPFIGIDMYPSFVSKMDGIFSMIGCEAYLVPKETGVKAAFDARMADKKIGEYIESTIHEMQQKLDMHFAQIAELLKGNTDGEQ